MKVLVSDKLADEGIEILQKAKGIKVDVNPTLTQEQLKKCIGNYDALIVRSRSKVTREVIERARKLKVIGRAGVGVDNIDVPTATKRGIIVMNTPAGNTVSTAEQTITLLLTLSRNTTRADASVRAGGWERKKFTGVEVYDKVMGIVGLGKIGTEVARRAKAFGMRIIAFDPFIAAEKAEHLEIKLVDFKELLKESDYITVHTPLTDETYHMIGKKEFARMKKGVRIINCARGGIVDEEALYAAIKNGRVAGAALDVFEKEPPKDNPLLKLDCVVTTPHLGASTREAQVKVGVDAAHQVIDALKGKSIRNALNIPSVGPELLVKLTPFISLAEHLGSLLAQITEGRFEQVAIDYKGIEYDTRPITIALIKGILEPILKETVNYINASLLAKERGLKVKVSESTTVENFANLIKITLLTDRMETIVEGTVFGENIARLVRIDDYFMDAVPEGRLLICKNKDLPGVIGKIGTTLGKNKVNIASFQLGRTTKGGIALSVLNLDSSPSSKILDKLKKIKEIVGVKLVEL